MSQAGSLKGSGGGGSGIIQTIAGDSGSITGANVTIYANKATKNAGSTVQFVNSGTISTFNVTDSNKNTFIGQNAGNVSVGSGANNTALGYNNLLNVTGSYNTAIGYNNASFLGSGSNNTFLGSVLGGSMSSGSYNLFLGNVSSAYTTSESNNILLNNPGVVGESNVMRLGTSGSSTAQVNKTFIAAIAGVTVANSSLVAVSGVGQLSSLPQGNSGQVLTSNGAGVSPTWQAGGGGKAAFSVNLSNGAGGINVTGDGTIYQVPFDVVLLDTDSGFTTGSSAHYTIPTTGNWQFQCSIDCFPQTGSGTEAIMLLETTSYSVTMQTTTYAASILNNQVCINGAITLPMSSGDTVSLTIQWAGGTKTCDIFGSSNIVTWLSGSQI